MNSTIWLLLLVLLSVGTVLFAGAVFDGEVLSPGDLIYFYEPWRSDFPGLFTKASNWILFDEILEFFPWRNRMVRALSHGQIPLWDPTAFCGYPFMSLFQTAFLYPIDRLLDPIPFHLFPLLRALIHILIAGAGTAIYLKHHGCSRESMLLGAVSYSFCGFMLVWLGHPHIKVAVWLPWLLSSVDRLFIPQSRYRLILFMSLLMTLLAGHIETALHTLSTAFLYLIMRIITDRSVRNNHPHWIYHSIAILIPVILISGAVVVPFAEYLVRSVAYATRSDGVVTQPYLDRILAITHLMPTLFGSSAGGSYWYPGFNSAEINSGFIGTIPLALAVIALLTPGNRKMKTVHGLIILVCGGVVYNIPPIYQLVTMLPGYKMSYNFRLTLPMAFSLTVLAAMQWESMRQTRQHRIYPILICVIGLIGLILLTPLWIGRIPMPTPAPEITVPILSALVPLLLLLCLLLVVSYHPRSWHVIGWQIILLTTLELIHFGSGFNPSFPRDIFHQYPVSAPYLDASRSGEPFRSLPMGRSYPPHICSEINMHDIRGNDALTPKIVEDYVSLIQPDILAARMLPALRMMWLDTYQSPLLDMLNVRYFVFPAGYLQAAPPHLIPDRRSGSVNIFINPTVLERSFLVSQWNHLATPEDVLNRLAQPGFDPRQRAYVVSPPPFVPPPDTTSPGNSRIVEYSDHRIRIDADCPDQRLLVLSDTCFPGWEATVDGTPATIYQTNHMMRGVFLEKGSHRITFSYRPVSFLFGLFLTLLGVFLSGCLAVLFTRPTIPKTTGMDRTSHSQSGFRI